MAKYNYKTHLPVTEHIGSLPLDAAIQKLTSVNEKIKELGGVDACLTMEWDMYESTSIVVEYQLPRSEAEIENTKNQAAHDLIKRRETYEKLRLEFDPELQTVQSKEKE